MVVLMGFLIYFNWEIQHSAEQFVIIDIKKYTKGKIYILVKYTQYCLLQLFIKFSMIESYFYFLFFAALNIWHTYEWNWCSNCLSKHCLLTRPRIPFNFSKLFKWHYVAYHLYKEISDSFLSHLSFKFVKNCLKGGNIKFLSGTQIYFQYICHWVLSFWYISVWAAL